MHSDDFSYEVIDNVVIEKINFSRATFKEATIFKSRLDKYLSLKHYRIIIDLSECSFVDSTFLGVMVVILKRVTEKSGEIKFIITNESLLNTLRATKLDRLFNLYSTKEDALKSFEYSIKVSNQIT